MSSDPFFDSSVDLSVDSSSGSSVDSLAELTAAVCKFAEQRDWDQFHSPKNLSMALIVEAAELVEHFQWLSRQESNKLNDEQHEAVSMEMADVLIYLVRMAERLDIDLLEAAKKKLKINDKKYPVEQAKGRSDKYTRYQTKQTEKNS
ncbi:MAG: nucleotide pyrophosphohydrolase [Candidatus Electrothrix sp. AR1]|nr:nucleotide pyrophosphohydrolase [Candidatus Electrothrix sp. AR1]